MYATNLFDDGEIVNTTNDINEGLKVEGFLTTCFGVTFDEFVIIDLIDDGDVNDEVKTAGFPRPQCDKTYYADQRRQSR